MAKPYARVHWGHLSGSRSEVSQSCRLWPLGCLGAEHSPIAPSPLLRARSWLHPFKGHCEQQAMRDERVIYVAGHPLLNRRCTSLPGCIRLRNDLYCVGWGAKLCSLTCILLFLHRKADYTAPRRVEGWVDLSLNVLNTTFLFCAQSNVKSQPTLLLDPSWAYTYFVWQPIVPVHLGTTSRFRYIFSTEKQTKTHFLSGH